ncbi:MAG: holo-ACP synthase [Chlamydiia bacterium]|nr:holo-ACP synthase [Chlamydiia bacterium]
MIRGLGTDIIEVARIAKVYNRFGNAFLERIFTPSEIAYLLSHKNPAERIAGHFAAKEAIAKALGTGIGPKLHWHDIALSHTPEGAPTAHTPFSGLLHLTISHTKTFATATAIYEELP